MHDFEKLGAFYLGRPYDLSTKQPKDGLVLYDSKDLVTHAVCVGMTGSGKTGLCLALLEEAAIDGIPSIVIDPKGDLTNLLLTFPDLKPDEFLPWVNEEDAEKKNLSKEQFAAQQAELWKKGLAEWGQDGARIKKLRDAADFRIYTPGSNAGIPISILKSFDAPPAATRDDEESLRERVSTTATSLLSLLGQEAEPLSRAHILLSTIFQKAWSAGQNLEMSTLIQQIQTPPVTRVGVMDLESFFPSKERFELAMSLNNLLAAPGFSAWMEGEPLDIQHLLYTSAGKPRVAIFSIAHLSDSERMFFVSLLLNQTLGWMRTQSGTTSLRSILYMDEIFGYFPPVANPPSKQPLLTLLKQGRAFGLGVVLVTQNPVDLDYKGLSNAGTWFIGRLQTDRDKSKVLEGLEGVAAGTGKTFDRQQMEQTIAGLGNRIFLMNNVHEDGAETFETRWAMSYLRGPLTRSQIKTLMQPIKESDESTTTAAAPVAPAQQAAPRFDKAEVAASERPALSPDVPQYFLPIRSGSGDDARINYRPMILGSAQVRFTDKKTDATREVMLLGDINDGPVAIDWDAARSINVSLSDLEQSPAAEAEFSGLPAAAAKAKNYPSWQKDFAAWLYRTQKLELSRSRSFGVASNPDESERDFRVRLQQLAREQRDESVEGLRQKYAPKIATLEERKRRAEQAVEREQEQALSQKFQTAISFGATLLSSFMGRKSVSLSTLGRATTAVKGVSRSMKESSDVGRAEETVAAIDQQLADLDAQFKEETDALERAIDSQNEELETISMKPTKANITVRLFTLVWVPQWQDSRGQLTSAWE
jgi:hypothetical protein